MHLLRKLIIRLLFLICYKRDLDNLFHRSQHDISSMTHEDFRRMKMILFLRTEAYV